MSCQQLFNLLDVVPMQNKCNVGYAFINMISPTHIISFYQVCLILDPCPLFLWMLLLELRVLLLELSVKSRLSVERICFALNLQAFNGKKWEKFNSEKVASLAYARIQGRTALISHFQNSSLMNEDKRCRPILFHPNGLESGNQVSTQRLAVVEGDR